MKAQSQHTILMQSNVKQECRNWNDYTMQKNSYQEASFHHITTAVQLYDPIKKIRKCEASPLVMSQYPLLSPLYNVPPSFQDGKTRERGYTQEGCI